MDTTNSHEFRPDSPYCVHCGTTRVALEKGQTVCISRGIAVAREPQTPMFRNEATINEIHARIIELRKEHDEALAKEPE